MFFLLFETSTVAFRSVLDELLCFFFALNLTSFRYFFRNLSFLLSCLLFGENLPRKSPRNSREIGRFLCEFVSSNPAKFHFFTRELSEALLGVLLLLLDGMLVHCRLPPAFHQVSLTVRWYPFLLLGGERLCESKVSCPRTQNNDPGQGLNPDLLIQGVVC